MPSAKKMFQRRLAQGEELIGENLLAAEMRLDQAGAWIPDDDARKIWEKKKNKIESHTKKEEEKIREEAKEKNIIERNRIVNDRISQLTLLRARTKLDTLRKIAIQKDLMPLE